jgi:hypothetical protein
MNLRTVRTVQLRGWDGIFCTHKVTETWTYGGIRADKDGKKWHAWLDAIGEEHWFARTGSGRMAVGSHYTAQVTRRDSGITLHGTPEYAGSQAGRETRAALWTAHTLAQARIEALRAERDAARRSALDEALAPLLELTWSGFPAGIIAE